LFVKTLGLKLSISFVVTFSALVGSAAPVVPGLSNKHPLAEPQVGDVLLNELRCTACHADNSRPSPLSERTAPDLLEVGARISPDFLRRFIASPSQTHAGTLMPDLLASETPVERERIAMALTHFLVAQSKQAFKQTPRSDSDAAIGKTLFHSVGCIACHAPRDEEGKEVTREGVVVLGHLSAKYSRNSLGEFLFQPTRIRPSGRMPDMKLTQDEARSISAYLLGGVETQAAPIEPQAELVADGKRHFQQLNCAACHKVGDLTAQPAPRALSQLDTARGCLSKSPGKTPRFDLTEDQIRAIQAALAVKEPVHSDKTLVAMTTTTFNCIACHVRDEYGGISADRNLLFTTTEKNLGDTARIPPPLTLVGAKLHTVSLKRMLFDADSVRPYMLTRMPQYGEPNLRQLPDLLARLDKIEEVALPIPHAGGRNEKERALEKELRAAGRELMGDRGLSCVACHNFNGKPSLANKGIDMMTFYQRLKPSWFYHFVRNPIAYRPGIVMPFSWPGGIAAHKTILKGDADLQIQAIWYFLSLGTSAQDPSGIQAVETKISVTDVTQTYRGRSSVAGYRGIAVGFPGGLNYAFNAETGSLTAIWRGEFIRVDRSGQGSGGFNPAGRTVALAQDVSFFNLADEKAAWPLRPEMSKSAPTNPDPLYPKNRGYQFRGYYLDEASTPTFMYRSGEVEIEDRSIADISGDKMLLRRTFQFVSPTESTTWFRALTGKVETESKQQFKVPGVRLSIPPTHTVLRASDSSAEASELLLQIDLPKGKSSRVFIYELLP